MKKRLVALVLATCVALTTFTVPVKAEELPNPEDTGYDYSFIDDRPVVTPEEYEEQNEETEIEIPDSDDNGSNENVDAWGRPIPPYVPPVVTGDETWDEMYHKIVDISRSDSYTDIHKFKEDFVKVYKKYFKYEQEFNERFGKYGNYFSSLNDRVCDYMDGSKKTPSKKELRNMLNNAEKKYKKYKKVCRKYLESQLDLVYWYWQPLDAMITETKFLDSSGNRKPMTAEEIKLQKKDLKELKKLKKETLKEFNYWWVYGTCDEGEIPHIDKIEKGIEKIEKGETPWDWVMKRVRKFVKSRI